MRSVSSCRILKEKIEQKKAQICVIGLGYVGLPLACALSQEKYHVIGYDTNSSRIRKLKKGEQYILDVDPKKIRNLIEKKRFFPTTNEKVLAEADVLVVAVPTPLRKVKIPDISYVIVASKAIAKYLRRAQLVIVESTSYPTTTREVVLPILKQSGLREGKDFFVCFSPERVNPGDSRHPLTRITKVVGGISQEASRLAKALYAKIIDRVEIVSSPEAAETAKLLENTFRLVNIALVNEFALFCHKLGINIWEVIEIAKTKPFGFMPFYPGPGCGGHCIPQDPLYLSWKAKKMGFKTQMIDLAHYINHFMPHYIIKRTIQLLKERHIPLSEAKILIIGVTYKKDVKDLRESPALEIIEELQRKKVSVAYYDPLMPYLKINTINLKRTPLKARNLQKYHCVVVVTGHSQVNYEFIYRHASMIFDTRNVYKTKAAPKLIRL